MASTQRDGTGVSAEFAQTNTHTPSAGTDITNKTYVDTALASASTGGFFFGGGINSSLTLGSNTNLADNQMIRQYTAVTLAGFQLGVSSDDAFIYLYISGTLSLGTNGTIISRATTAAQAGGGTGGASGQGFYGVWVYAAIITGTGIIGAPGTNGVAGANGVLNSGRTGGGNGSASSVSQLVYAINQGNITAAAGLVATGGAGGAYTRNDTMLSSMYDLVRLMYVSDVTYTNAGIRTFQVGPGGGGAGGPGGINTDPGQTGGGAGGGGCGLMANGGAGGNGTAGSGTYNTANGGQAGGAGGGGGGGGFTFVITGNAPSTLTVSAKGGNGGQGGNGVTGGGGVSGAGGGGGGGGGGYASLVAQSGNTATLTAAGGTLGTAGTNSSGAAGNNGVAGGTGVTVSMVK